MSRATFCAVLIRASSWLTRWLIGALEPTQGQAVEAALGGLGRTGHAGQRRRAEQHGGGGDGR